MGMPNENKVDGQEVLNLSIPESLDGRIIGWTLNATVPATVIVAAVAVGLTIRFIMLHVVGDQIVSVNPSWHVMKFTLCSASRSSQRYISPLPRILSAKRRK